MIALSQPFIRSWFYIKPGLLQGNEKLHTPTDVASCEIRFVIGLPTPKFERSVSILCYPQGLLLDGVLGSLGGRFMKENWSSPPHASAQAAGDKEIA